MLSRGISRISLRMWRIPSLMTLLRITKMYKIVLLAKMVAILVQVGIKILGSICKQLGNLLQQGEEEVRWTTSWMMVLSQLLQLIMELLLTMNIIQ